MSGIAATASVAAAGATLGRLTKIEIRNYRAYRGEFRIDLPNGQNLLVYGENGAGKSSLYHTLRVFLEAPDYSIFDTSTRKRRPLAAIDHRHRFTTDAPEIRLEFGTLSFNWSETKNDTTQNLVRLANQGKGFLDYKALLGVHYAPVDQAAQIDLFPLVIGQLLPYYTYPNRGRTSTFQRGWKDLNSLVRQSWFGAKEQRFREDLDAFNAALERAIGDLGKRASAMLGGFDAEFATEFHFEKAQFFARPKRIVGPRILLRPAFQKLQFPDYHSFFNEARLSAIAICLFFAALKESPATGLRILALDDILIGLDMGNRLKVMELVHKSFADWQILVFTYSKAWFERLKDHVKSNKWTAPWSSVVLWDEWRDQENSPRVVVEGSGALLETAERHLQRKDYSAAAVYARKALEGLCHRICARAAIPVQHVEHHRERNSDHFIHALERRLEELLDDERRAKALQLIARVRQARSFVLNRQAHFDVEEEDVLSAEVLVAIKVVADLTAFLDEQDWKKEKFNTGRQADDKEMMMAHLAVARLLCGQKAWRQCQNAIKRAHHCAWMVYGTKRGVLMTIGVHHDASAIWKAALDQAKLPAEIAGKCDALKGYLFGSVPVKDFDAARFEQAAMCLEELTA